MNYSYFPGCTLRTHAQDLDRYARASLKALGSELIEVPEWQCCGGVYSTAKDEIANKLSSVRALVAARDAGQDLVSVCSACHNVLKQTNEEMKHNEEFRNKANAYMQLETPYEGETNVIHFLELLRDRIGFDEIAKKVVNPFKGKKIGAYYGCLLLRPGKVMNMDTPENPKILEDFIKAIGGTPVIYAMRNECCGGYITLEDKSIASKRSGKILTNAEDCGAEMLVTACPLCLYNLKKNSAGHNVPIFYFTELLAEALGVKEGN